MDDDALATLLPDADWKRQFRRRLLAWYRQHARDLPWRRRRSLYRTWISEIMLQQTQVVTVIPYFERFVASFPDVAALAAASEQQVLRHWEGLGYYRRARQLHQAARQIVDQHGGQFPETLDAVLALPGVGRYTAGAILSIALDARQPILEANTIRLFSRLLAYRDDPLRSIGQKLLWQFAEQVLPRQNVGTFNQALMELGSEICTPKAPDCDRCPAMMLCPTRRQQLQDEIPLAKKKTRYEPLWEAAVVVWRDGRVLLRQCAADERWAGLWDFPRFQVAARQGAPLQRELIENVQRLTGVTVSPRERLATLKHGVTRYRITLLCHQADYVSGHWPTADALQWSAPERLTDFPLSTTGRKISRLVMAN